jgi:hypothetical protein
MVPSPDRFSDHLRVLAVIGMVLGQNLDQLLKGAVPEVAASALLRVAGLTRWQLAVGAVIDVEPVHGRFRALR